jgi:voltage-gated potassium channel
MTTLRRFRLALLGLALIVLGGVTGYVVIERWSVFDALYMTVITLATIGYGEVRPLSMAGRVFTMVLIASGLTVGAYIAGAFTELIVAEKFREIVERRRMKRELERLSGHYIICGWGRMGQEIADEFLRKRVPFVVVELSEEKCRRLAERGLPYVQGDASEDQALEGAGVKRARGLVAVAPRDADNIFITLSARSLKKDLFIVARSVHERDAHKLEIAGADRVVSPYVIGARRMAAACFHPTVVDFLDLEVRHEDLEWELDDIPVTPHAMFAGKTVRDSRIREETGCTILAIREATTNRFHSNPSADTVLNLGDTLIVLGTPAQIEHLEELAAMPAEARRPHIVPGERRS